MLPLDRGLIPPGTPGGHPASWVATGRSGGISASPYDSLNLAGYVGDDDAAVAENRSRLALAVGAAPDRVAVMDSVHGADIAVVDRPGVVPGVDALITREPGLVLVALGADCVPVALVGDDGRTVAAIHSGWRGLVADVVGATIAALADRGVGVGAVVLGPSVCGACYPVPPERAAEVETSCSPAVTSAAVVRCADGQPGIDVRAGLLVRLRELGVPDPVVHLAGGCTVEDPGLFSYRRDGVTGRQGMAVMLVPATGRMDA